MSNPLDLEIARLFVNDYTDETMREHEAAMACRDCEEHLQKGINAYQWLSQSERTIREGVYRGLVEPDNEFSEAVEAMYIAWLRPCGYAEELIAVHQANGYNLDNLNEFRRCCEEVRAWIEENEWRKRAKKAHGKSLAQEPW